MTTTPHDSPVYVEPFLGAGATWLRLLDARLVPLVSWMGGKRRQADEHLALLDLRSGRPVPSVLGDASWWGWVWPTVLDAETGPRVSEVLRSWRGEDPRALWFRLREAGPMSDRAEAAAQLLWLQARAASGVPVWWQCAEVVAMDGHGRGPYRAFQATSLPALVQDRGWKSPTCSTVNLWPATQGGADEILEGRRERRATLVQHASTKIDAAGQRQAIEPTLLASDGRGVPRECGHKADKGSDGRTGGIVDPGTVAARVDAVREACAKGRNATGAGGIVDPGTVAGLTIEHTDAADLTRRWAPVLGARARVLLDPPYQGATGYPVTCPRETVLDIARAWANHGARVVLCEASPLAGDLGAGWTSVKGTQGKKIEWLTVYGCDVRDLLPPVLRACVSAA